MLKSNISETYYIFSFCSTNKIYAWEFVTQFKRIMNKKK